MSGSLCNVCTSNIGPRGCVNNASNFKHTDGNEKRWYTLPIECNIRCFEGEGSVGFFSVCTQRRVELHGFHLFVLWYVPFHDILMF